MFLTIRDDKLILDEGEIGSPMESEIKSWEQLQAVVRGAELWKSSAIDFAEDYTANPVILDICRRLRGVASRMDICFIHRETKRTFWAQSGAPNMWAYERGATHSLEVSNRVGYGPWRPAIIKKTVAYIGVDEDADGNIVWEKWPIRHRLP